MGLSGQITNCLKQYVNSFPLDKLFLSRRIFVHHHISYDMYLSSHTRGIPKKSGPSDQFRTYSGPLLALRSGSGPSPEFRTLVVPLMMVMKRTFGGSLSSSPLSKSSMPSTWPIRTSWGKCVFNRPSWKKPIMAFMTHFKIEVRSLCKGVSKILTAYRI